MGAWFVEKIGKKTQMAAFVLAQFSLQDQFGNKIEWGKFSAVPRVLVLGGEKAGEEAKKWGVYLQKKYNSSYEPRPDHLQTLSQDEKVKVIAIATLPHVPGLFKGLFRSGFRKASKTMGLGLDFGSELSAALGYSADDQIPKVVVLSPDEKSEPLFFKGKVDNEAVTEEVDQVVSSLVKSPTKP